jgi:hypothetical protein
MTGILDRCSAVTRAAGVDPIGSAGSYDGFVLVEHPLPWGRDISEQPALAGLVAALEAAPGRWRVQGLVPEDPAGPRRIIVFRRSEPFTGYERAEATAGPGDLAAVAVGLMAGSGGETEPGTDVLVCTHGRRDVCCGTTGTSLWKELTERLHVFDGSVRLWRTSHTGGHRYAPTGAVFPSGQYWAWLDAELLRRIVQRRGEAAGVAAHYRGSAAMPGPAAQAVEREAFAAEGWAWLDYRRRGRETPDGTSAVVEFERPDGSRGTYEGTVVVERMVPVPVCGEPIEAATKAEPEIRVVDLILS